MGNVYIKTVDGGEQTTPTGAHAIEIDTGTTSMWVLLSNLYLALGTGTPTAEKALLGDGSWGTVSSFWTAFPGTPVRASNTTFTVTGDYSSATTYPYGKGMVIKWTETGTVRVGMISIPPTYSAPNTTVTIIGDTMASIDSDSLKYAMVKATEVILSCYGSIDAVIADQFGEYTPSENYRVFGSNVNVKTAGTTNSSTFDINKNGTSMFTTKPTLASTVRYSTAPFTADSGTSIGPGDQVTGDIDAIQTTVAVDAHLHLLLFPTSYLYLA